MSEKLTVVWDKYAQCYVCYHSGTNVTGEGSTPGEAIRNWIFWWECPY